jgi:Mrp family chromosome partitioning ATPase
MGAARNGLQAGSSDGTSSKEDNIVLEGRFQEGSGPIASGRRIAQALGERFRLILGVTLACLLLSALWSLFFYRDRYQATGVVSLRPFPFPTMSSQAETNACCRGYLDSTPDGRITQHFFAQLRTEKLALSPEPAPESPAAGRLTIHALPEAGLARVTVTAATPELARRMAKKYTERYVDFLNTMADPAPEPAPAWWREKIRLTGSALDTLNRRIREQRQRFGILDLDVDRQAQVGEIWQLDAAARMTQASLAQWRGEATHLRAQLKLKPGEFWSKALPPSANPVSGHSVNRPPSLRPAGPSPDAPGAETRTSAGNAAGESTAEPGMLPVALSDNLRPDVPADDPNPKGLRPLDARLAGIRLELINRLAVAEAGEAALRNRLVRLDALARQRRQAAGHLSQREWEQARLNLDRISLEEEWLRLRQGLSEADIHQAAFSAKNRRERSRILALPIQPTTPVPPLPWQIVLFSGVLGLLSSSGWVIACALARRYPVRAAFVEETLGVPVLATIPWICDEHWQYYRQRGRLEVMAGVEPGVLNAYYDLTLHLKGQRRRLGCRSLLFASLQRERGQAVIMGNLAFCLAQGGERVLLVDADLRSPSLHRLFHHELDYDSGLPELINSISERLYQDKEPPLYEIQTLLASSVRPSDMHPNLDYLNAGLALEQRFEFLGARGFASLIQAAQTDYDWILVDSPPFLDQPDAAILLGWLDGLVLLVEREADENQVALAHRKVQKLNSTTVGMVLRGPG